MPDILDEGGAALLDEGGGFILDELDLNAFTTGSWWGLDSVSRQSRSELTC